MKHIKLLPLVMGMSLVVFLVGCSTSAATSTVANPTATPIPPAATPVSEAIEATTVPIPQTPSGRGGHAMAYDSESGRAILFGGSNSGDELDINDDTWAYDFDSSTWTDMKPAAGPGPVTYHAMAYDAESDRVILFGGVTPDQDVLKDTWAYDFNSNAWTERQPPAAPLARGLSRMVYDSESDRIILFGGVGDVFNGERILDDTWTYDFNTNTWTELQPEAAHPSRRYAHQMAYDAESDRVILWGGHALDKNVWAYDYNTDSWEELESSNGPKPFLNGAMVYNAATDQVILHKDLDLWTYDYNSNTWTQLELAPDQLPGLLSYHAMVYHTPTDRIITFGGGFDFNNLVDETWAFDLNETAWTKVGPNP